MSFCVFVDIIVGVLLFYDYMCTNCAMYEFKESDEKEVSTIEYMQRGGRGRMIPT